MALEDPNINPEKEKKRKYLKVGIVVFTAAVLIAAVIVMGQTEFFSGMLKPLQFNQRVNLQLNRNPGLNPSVTQQTMELIPPATQQTSQTTQPATQQSNAAAPGSVPASSPAPAQTQQTTQPTQPVQPLATQQSYPAVTQQSMQTPAR